MLRNMNTFKALVKNWHAKAPVIVFHSREENNSRLQNPMTQPYFNRHILGETMFELQRRAKTSCIRPTHIRLTIVLCSLNNALV